MKRILDIIFSLLLIILLSPLFLILSFMILVSCGRPIFFKQKRVGKDRKEFILYKFRSMVQNAEQEKYKLLQFNEAAPPFFKMKDDPRITPIGRVLRKLSLDELPQLFNILKGDMSFVGPRPTIVEEARYLSGTRFKCRPGLTGPTQIFREKVLNLNEIQELEDNYVNKNSIFNDFIIVLKTFAVVFKGE